MVERPLIRLAAGVVLLLALLAGTGAALWRPWTSEPDRGGLATSAEQSTLERLRAREERLLGSYGWVDPDAGIARIPIEDAMHLLAGQGWPEAR
jgi:hypothetical protein